MTTTTARASKATRTTRTTRGIHVHIAGMTCASCVNHVRSALERIPGARVIDVKRGGAAVELQPEVDASAVVTAIAEAGYRVIGIGPLDAVEEYRTLPDPGGSGGCCCGPEAAHAAMSPRRRRRRGAP